MDISISTKKFEKLSKYKDLQIEGKTKCKT